MSPVSGGRKGKKNNRKTKRPTRQQPPVLLDMSGALEPGALEHCDCPACAEADFDPQQMIDAMVASIGDRALAEDPLDAEFVGAAFLSLGMLDREAFEEALVDGFITELEARPSTEAMVMLLAIGAVGGGQVSGVATAAADRLARAGVPHPGWAAELAEPVTVTDCCQLSDPRGTASILACVFHRAGRSHAFMVTVDHLDDGAASDILVLDEASLSQALEMILNARDKGFEFIKKELEPAELRGQCEKALDIRAVHDGEQPGWEVDDLLVDEDDPPDFPTLAVVLRARMNALPVPDRPLAPVYQIKVGLRGAKPPIWRRLEVPADISLGRLHMVIQIAFGWDDSHLHVFETPYGEFGMPDPEFGRREEASVTLEQVAPRVRSTIRYTYDFGDDWEHDIMVEKVLDRDESVTYPRCTGGKRATPPEDCGGVWGYAHLVEVLADPSHSEHGDLLEWLDLDKAPDFDPAHFDAEPLNRELSRLR